MQENLSRSCMFVAFCYVTSLIRKWGYGKRSVQHFRCESEAFIFRRKTTRWHRICSSNHCLAAVFFQQCIFVSSIARFPFTRWNLNSNEKSASRRNDELKMDQITQDHPLRLQKTTDAEAKRANLSYTEHFEKSRASSWDLQHVARRGTTWHNCFSDKVQDRFCEGA